MNEKIEQVAKAIQAKCKERGYPECPAPLVHHIAVAAIEAMREPTEAMNIVGAEEWPNHYKIWTKMIDEALK